ncbi:Zinc finger BED domain-containing protein 1 [Anabarilius grahami]|uniref:Zinc finger BED domain-containing protein 1 n=1 Tax=Anabarilius grahami TaxID=495550 RepID=A0A3N0XKN0_ANAGA|nr:Zinc finger BED domain-containing protein 1 [Anabarilius grahami]
MKKHITRFHSELEKQHSLPITNTPGYIQRTLDQVAKLPPNSEKAKRITRSVAGFIAKDLRPYSVVENQGFRTMLQEVRKGADEIFTLTESDISCSEDVITALKPMKDATLLMSEESSPTACLIAPLHAKLIQDMKENTEEKSVMIREIKRVICEDLSKRYTTDQETSLLNKCASLDPRFKALPFLSKEMREETYKTLITEASSLQEEVPDNLEDSTVKEANISVSPQPEVTELQDDCPTTSKGRASSLLHNLLGQTFSDASDTPYHQSPSALVEEEMTSEENVCCKMVGWW